MPLIVCCHRPGLLRQMYNSSAELDLASRYPDVRIFQVALETSAAELRDLSGIAVPWSVPTAGELCTGGTAGSPACVCVCVCVCVCSFGGKAVFFSLSHI